VAGAVAVAAAEVAAAAAAAVLVEVVAVAALAAAAAAGVSRMPNLRVAFSLAGPPAPLAVAEAEESVAVVAIRRTQVWDL